MRDLCEPLNKVHSVSTMIKIDFVSIRIQLIKVKPEPQKVGRGGVKLDVDLEPGDLLL